MYADDMMLYVGIPKDSTEKQLELITKFSKCIHLVTQFFFL